MNQIPEIETKSKTPLGLFVVAIVIPILLCIFSFVSVAFGTIFFGAASSDFSIYDNNSERAFYTDSYPREYIDPSVDSEAIRFIQSSAEHFVLVFEESTFGGNYQSEADFILANLESNYQKLSTRLGVTYDSKYSIIITDKQDYYEEKFGFEFDYELPYAGLTSKNEMVLLIREDLLYTKDDFNKLLAHEVVHTMQFQSMLGNIITYPTWFSEGTAEYFAGTPLYPFDYYEKSGTLVDLRRLDDAYYSGDSDLTFAGYNMSNHFVYFLTQQFGEANLVELMVPEPQSSTFYSTFTDLYSRTPDEMYEKWFDANVSENIEEYDISAEHQPNMLYNTQPR